MDSNSGADRSAERVNSALDDVRRALAAARKRSHKLSATVTHAHLADLYSVMQHYGLAVSSLETRTRAADAREEREAGDAVTAAAAAAAAAGAGSACVVAEARHLRSLAANIFSNVATLARDLLAVAPRESGAEIRVNELLHAAARRLLAVAECAEACAPRAATAAKRSQFDAICSDCLVKAGDAKRYQAMLFAAHCSGGATELFLYAVSLRGGVARATARDIGDGDGDGHGDNAHDRAHTRSATSNEPRKSPHQMPADDVANFIAHVCGSLRLYARASRAAPDDGARALGQAAVLHFACGERVSAAYAWLCAILGRGSRRLHTRDSMQVDAQIDNNVKQFAALCAKAVVAAAASDTDDDLWLKRKRFGELWSTFCVSEHTGVSLSTLMASGGDALAERAMRAFVAYAAAAVAAIDAARANPDSTDMRHSQLPLHFLLPAHALHEDRYTASLPRDAWEASVALCAAHALHADNATSQTTSSSPRTPFTANDNDTAAAAGEEAAGAVAAAAQSVDLYTYTLCTLIVRIGSALGDAGGSAAAAAHDAALLAPLQLLCAYVAHTEHFAAQTLHTDCGADAQRSVQKLCATLASRVATLDSSSAAVATSSLRAHYAAQLCTITTTTTTSSIQTASPLVDKNNETLAPWDELRAAPLFARTLATARGAATHARTTYGLSSHALDFICAVAPLWMRASFEECFASDAKRLLDAHRRRQRSAVAARSPRAHRRVAAAAVDATAAARRAFCARLDAVRAASAAHVRAQKRARLSTTIDY